MRNSRTRQPAAQQTGYTLVSVLIIVMIVSIMASGSMDLGHVSEKSAGNAIQRNRAFQAADGGVAIAENQLQRRLGTRIFADNIASEGIFSSGAYTQKWWRTATYSGETTVPDDAILGDSKSPRYILEEVGQFTTDGGSGVVALDLGSAAYGSQSSGRDVVLYRIETHGTGSYAEVQSVVETVVGFSY